MGYCMKKRAAKFSIRKENFQGAHEAVNVLNPPSKTLFHALEDWGWDADVDANGDIIDICFLGEKLGDEIKLFKALAPFVEADSYIEMQGEDGDLWRWVFDGKAMVEKKPSTVW
jgi:hypothetical protein